MKWHLGFLDSTTADGDEIAEEFMHKPSILKVRDVYKYIWASTSLSSYMSEAQDWTKWENFDIVEIIGTKIKLRWQDRKTIREVERIFFNGNFRFRTNHDIKASRVAFAGQAMAAIEE